MVKIKEESEDDLIPYERIMRETKEIDNDGDYLVYKQIRFHVATSIISFILLLSSRHLGIM